ncbi:hypothetical protein M5X11_04900 [Paenibacillus alginolyticus]|uniref:Uncharacterized protein n=1 Tax=Paenibacillus alginolyticus TaxID=59839 RepID=A0ABT4GCB4_9BACL|nr:hypothetical protein [Paenibacillus alginolyticus]MCY9664316.1 hypothetical protein [Paenibacillus alginolyticus]MCY9693838.1 hypothetical protein [Paenibacillus alginolyticus]MEC0148173.1 hypothetical protein [Paenibacillus alginolyticus]
MSKEFHLTTARKVPLKTQKRIKNISPGLIGSVVVVRTLFNTFTGCLLSVGRNTIRLRFLAGLIDYL